MQKEKYDVIIVGAGIGGLVCATYLAKSGKKILILEKNSTAGGLCTSFRRRDFVFDAGVHYLSSCRTEGCLGKLFEDLKIRINFLKLNPADIVYIAGYKIDFGASVETTKKQLQDYFPAESINIDIFLTFLMRLDINNAAIISKYFYELRNLSFEDVLKKYFKNKVLKNIFAFIIFNIGLHPKEVSALYSLYILREFIFDGGYYPEGGIRVFPEMLVKAFINFGGKILFEREVDKIIINRNSAVAAKSNSELFYADQFVINSDVHDLFFNLIGTDYLKNDFIRNFKSLKISRSLFLLHLALSEKLDALPQCVWYSKNFELDKIFNDFNRRLVNTSYVFSFFPSVLDRTLCPRGKESGYLAIICPYFSRSYWSEKKRLDISNRMLSQATNIYPDLQKKIEFSFTSTPNTILKYTKNYNGAAYGWASLVGMEGRENFFSFKTNFTNLFICGHWATSGIGYGGIPMVVYRGIKMSEYLLR